MKQDAKRELKPKLRFPEFQGEPEWKAEKLGSVASLITERAGNTKCIPMSITSGVGLVSQQEKFGRTIAGNQYKNYLVLQKNDFAYNKSATKEFPQGFIAMYLGDEPAAVPNSMFTCFRAHKDAIVPDFLNYLFLGNLHGKWLKKYIEVSARAHGSLSIDDEDLLTLPIPLPSGELSRAEQQKIAECLTSLDELIAAHGQRLDALKAHKKGLMQQLFPREGETLPRLRFPEFQDAEEWREGPIGEIAEVLQGYGFPERYQGQKTGDYPFYKVSDISNSVVIGKVFIDESANYINENVLKELKAKPIPIGTTIFAKIGEAIRLNRRAIATRPCLIDNNAAGLKRIEERAVDLFVYFLMGTISLIDYAGDGVVPAVNKSAIENITVAYPKIEEQQKIADCLSSLDDLITVQTQKIDALKTHKKGLMQQLFPSAEEVEA